MSNPVNVPTTISPTSSALIMTSISVSPASEADLVILDKKVSIITSTGWRSTQRFGIQPLWL